VVVAPPLTDDSTTIPGTVPVIGKALAFCKTQTRSYSPGASRSSRLGVSKVNAPGSDAEDAILAPAMV